VNVTDALEEGRGTLRLAPTWVPRSFCVPGKRIKLHPHDYYALGAERGGIDERWLSSTVKADNGPLTGGEEGLSIVVDERGERVATLAEAVDELGATLVGERIWAEHIGWPMYSKFFDNQGPLPFHVHHRDEHAALVGRQPKPEAYFFPPQMNNHGGDLPISYLGLRPGVTKEAFRDRIARFGQGDTRITELSTGYRLEPGQGWDIPAGVLHAPGSFCTYEPQQASDVFAMCECVNNGRAVPEELLWKDVPDDRRGDPDFIVELIDWDTNVSASFAAERFMEPIPVSDTDGFDARWVVYKSDAFSAKELTIPAGRTVTVRDAGAYGLIVVQGHGTLNGRPIETPSIIRYGQPTNDELFVSAGAASDGVTITNPSTSDPIVILQHFGPANPEVPR
jgi:hypothetical protein